MDGAQPESEPRGILTDAMAHLAGLPLELRQMVYDLVLCPGVLNDYASDRMDCHFLGPNNLRRTCRRFYYELRTPRYFELRHEAARNFWCPSPSLHYASLLDAGLLHMAVDLNCFLVFHQARLSIYYGSRASESRMHFGLIALRRPSPPTGQSSWQSLGSFNDYGHWLERPVKTRVTATILAMVLMEVLLRIRQTLWLSHDTAVAKRDCGHVSLALGRVGREAAMEEIWRRVGGAV